MNARKIPIILFLWGMFNGASVFADTRVECSVHTDTIKQCVSRLSGIYWSNWTTSLYGITYRINFHNSVGNMIEITDQTNNVTFTLPGTLTFGSSTRFSGQYVLQRDYLHFYLHSNGVDFFIRAEYSSNVMGGQQKLLCVDGEGSACRWISF